MDRLATRHGFAGLEKTEATQTKGRGRSSASPRMGVLFVGNQQIQKKYMR
jgi:hypothetical protein